MCRTGVSPTNPHYAYKLEWLGALRELVSAGKVRPAIGRRIAMGDVAAALEDHEQRRTTGRTVVDLSLG